MSEILKATWPPPYYAKRPARAVLKFILGTYVLPREGVCLEQDQDENFLAEIDYFS